MSPTSGRTYGRRFTRSARRCAGPASSIAPPVAGGNLRGTHTYNGLEQVAIRVMSNQTPSGTLHSLYDRAGNLLAETDGSGATGATREYIWLPDAEIAPTAGSRTKLDRPIAVVADVSTCPVLYWVHVDHLHRPIRMTDAAKVQVWDAVWKPWGEPDSINGSVSLDARFPGQWFQIEAGLHYNWHRHYDASIGRYSQPDPLGFIDGASVYAYVKASPLALIDVRGLQGTDEKQPSSKPDPTDPQCFSKCFSNQMTLCTAGASALTCPICVKAPGRSLKALCVVGCVNCLAVYCRIEASEYCSKACTPARWRSRIDQGVSQWRIHLRQPEPSASRMIFPGRSAAHCVLA